MDFSYHFKQFSLRIKSSLESHVTLAKKIEEISHNAKSSGTDIDLVRISLSNLRKCRHVLPPKCFFPFKSDFKYLNRKYESTVKILDKSVEDAINRHDIATLVGIHPQNPKITALLQSKFSIFIETVARGHDLLVSLNLVISECPSWYRFSPHSTEVAVKSLIEHYASMLSLSAGGLNRLQWAEVVFVEQKFHILLAFLTCADKLKRDVTVLGNDPSIQPVIEKTVVLLNSVVSLFHKMAVDIDSIIRSFEANIPKIPENAFTSTVTFNVNDLIRFLGMWKEVSDHETAFNLISSLKYTDVNKKRILLIQSLKLVPERVNELKDRSMQLLHLPFNNVKTNTQNRTDKDTFFSLIYLSYRFLISQSTADDSEQITKQVRSQIDSVSVSCLKIIDSIKPSVDATSDIFANFNKTFCNLLTIKDFFISDLQVNSMDITKRFEEKINVILSDAIMTEGQWSDWLKHIESLCKKLILLKSIARNVPAFSSFIEDGIAEILRKYQHRCDTEEIAKDFIARLGAVLESSVSNGVGQKIIEDHPIFAGYKNFLRNLQFERVPMESILINIESIERNVLTLANQVGSSITTAVTTEGILRLVSHTFAYWTLNNLNGYDTTPTKTKSRNYLSQPHPGQVIVVLRLLGLDRGEEICKARYVHHRSRTNSAQDFLKNVFVSKKKCKFSFKNHLAEILTGEGKSIVLAVTATVLALLDFDVDIACYSEYLTQRDKGAFLFLFKAFGVSDRIQYNTFKKLCESILASQGDIRELVGNTILGKSTAHFDRSFHTAARHRILLGDEVDVLFGSNFFGKSYNVFTSLRGTEIPEIVALVNLIWKFRNTDKDSVWHKEIVPSPEYQACCNAFKDWSFLIENAAKRMLCDVRDVDHKVDDVHPDFGIGYFDDDNVLSYNKRVGYKTLFAYMRENAKDNTNITDKQVLGAMDILVNAGVLSYAELPKLYSVTLGVTGTLQTLSLEENNMLDREYNIQERTIMPSAYPSRKSKTPFFSGRLGIDVIASNSGNFFENIAKEIAIRIIDKTGKKRAVLVFFYSDAVLEDFSTSVWFKEYSSSALKLTTKTSPKDRDNIIDRAVEEGRVTLLIAAYGRGTDFTYNNKELDERGGIHVIQTFFSKEKSEEIQIQGRTKRQGHPGTYSMVLNESDFESGGITVTALAAMPHGKDIHQQMMNYRTIQYGKKCMERKELSEFKLVEHNESQVLLQHLWNNNLSEVKRIIEDRNLAKVEFGAVVSRTIILLDATGSMHLFFNKCKTVVKEMLKRVCEILNKNSISSGFEIQFVVYRNYTSKAKLLEASSWESDPVALSDFIDGAEISGGVGGNESIETAFWHVNQETEKGEVTQVIIIGDQGPNTKNEILRHRESVESDGLTGDAYWKEKTVFKEQTFYKDELAKICSKNIPIHARYLKYCYDDSYPAKLPFEEFARDNGGTAAELQIDAPISTEQLTTLFAGGILRNIQARSKNSHVDLYNEYLRKYPEGHDVGFV